jgi:UDP-N-acetyl-D-glucosamine dehydrogenase
MLGRRRLQRDNPRGDAKLIESLPHPMRLVVIGLGYVGLPLAREATEAGLTVVGLDTSQVTVDLLCGGRSHVDDISDGDVEAMLEIGFRATTDPSVICSADVVVICVPTPLSPDGAPDLSAVVTAATTISEFMRPGQLIVLESTTYPGTTEEVLVPLLEESGLSVGRDFFCAFSPERIDPGNVTFGLRNTPKVVGGITPSCNERATRFYSLIVDKVVQAKGVREAEMTKLLENTYRHVNIALMNEMARFCHELKIDLWDTIACASTKPFGFAPFYPGPGVGGHCIPIDPNYLSHRVRTHLGFPFRFVELAQEINSGMPAYVASRAQTLLNEESKSVRGSSILLVGVTYKPDIADQRESPSLEVAQILQSLGAHIQYHDPYVPEWSVNGHSLRSVDDLMAASADADITILLQPHAYYDLESLALTANRVLDTRGAIQGPKIHRL